MALVAGAVPIEKIYIFSAIGVPDVQALALDDGDWQGGVVVGHIVQALVDALLVFRGSIAGVISPNQFVAAIFLKS